MSKWISADRSILFSRITRCHRSLAWPALFPRTDPAHALRQSSAHNETGSLRRTSVPAHRRAGVVRTSKHPSGKTPSGKKLSGKKACTNPELAHNHPQIMPQTPIHIMCSKQTFSHGTLQVLLSGLVAGLAVGCVSNQLKVNTEPPGSLVTITGPKGDTLKSGPAPMDTQLSFSKPADSYTIDVRPTGAATDRYLASTRNLTLSGYAALPEVKGPNYRRLDFKLIEKYHLNVDSIPTGSVVVVKDPTGAGLKSGPAPIEVDLDFTKGSEIYVVEVSPPDSLADKYFTNSTQVSVVTFTNLPQGKGPNNRRLDIKLEEKQFVTFPYVEVVLDVKQTWRGAVTLSRAYRDVSEAAGTVPTRIVDFGDNIGVQSMAISPDGNRIVYSMAAYNLSPTDLQKVFSAAEPRNIDIAGANLRAVTISAGGIEQITSENFRDFFPSFCPDGTNLLFTSNRRRANSEDILRMSAVRRSGISDIHVLRDARGLRPTEAKDGTMAFAVEVSNPLDEKQRFTIWTLGGDNQFPTQIQIGNQPAISPDGKRIAFIGQDGNLWVVNSDGSQPTQLTMGAEKIIERYKASLNQEELTRYGSFIREFGFPEKQAFSYPSWSADGKYILYTAMEGSDPTGRPNEDIWIMQYDGNGKRQLTTNGSIDRYPLMSPDGKWVYFLSNRGGRWAIWRIPIQ